MVVTEREEVDLRVIGLFGIGVILLVVSLFLPWHSLAFSGSFDFGAFGSAPFNVQVDFSFWGFSTEDDHVTFFDGQLDHATGAELIRTGIVLVLIGGVGVLAAGAGIAAGKARGEARRLIAYGMLAAGAILLLGLLLHTIGMSQFMDFIAGNGGAENAEAEADKRLNAGAWLSWTGGLLIVAVAAFRFFSAQPSDPVPEAEDQVEPEPASVQNE